MSRTYSQLWHEDLSVLEVDRVEPHSHTHSIIERKGWGHPDTLADHLGESLSREYSRYTRDTYGAILHHNFDKLAILGGSSRVAYGSGELLTPIKVLVNGRAAEAFGGKAIPTDEIVRKTVAEFFRYRLPEVGENIELTMNVTSNSSPGAVEVDGKKSDRSKWFAPESLEDLRERSILISNDTSLGTGWAPLSRFEHAVCSLADRLSHPDQLPSQHDWWGTDVKVMAYYSHDTVDVVACIPQKCVHVGSRDEYLENLDIMHSEVEQFLEEAVPQTKQRIRLNLRDIPEKDELYLTYTGSSIESGDEGVVGRGNRINGMITPLRPMNLEGVAGKNPVYHVGKLYNIMANRIAQAIHHEHGGDATVHLVSGTGQRLDRPWRILVQISERLPHAVVEDTVLRELATFPKITERLLSDTEQVLS